jgi:hypothetical protein
VWVIAVRWRRAFTFGFHSSPSGAKFGYDPKAANYFLAFRNPVLSFFTAGAW